MAPFYSLRRRMRHWAEAMRQDATDRLNAWRIARCPQAELVAELDLADFGADNLWIADVDGDGEAELLWYQSQGIFKSSNYRQRKNADFLTRGSGLSCLTVTDTAGRIKWQRGTPFQGTEPYVSHAGERMLDVVTSDGRSWIAVLETPDQLALLDGATGALIRHRALPNDTFGVVAGLTTPQGEPRFVVSVMDAGAGDEPYGAPTLFLDEALQTQATCRPLGSGHRIWACDVDQDGHAEILDGYELLDHHGQRRWLLDSWQGQETSYDPKAQHLDHVSPIQIEGQWYAAIAGSDRLYWIDAQGRVRWQAEPRHAQYAFAGHFRGREAAPVVLLVDSLVDTYLRAYDLEGNEMWCRPAVRNWPKGCPPHLRASWFHMGEPAAHWQSPDNRRPDLMIFCEGGWPYAIDGSGRTALGFPWQPRAARVPKHLPAHRADDFGEAFQVRCHDIDGDGEPEVVLFDRHSAWIFRVPSEIPLP